MTLLERIDYLQKAWSSLLPHIPAPAPEDVARWCNYSDTVMDMALLRTAKKFNRSKIDPNNFQLEDAYRYATGTARLIAGQTKEVQ